MPVRELASDDEALVGVRLGWVERENGDAALRVAACDERVWRHYNLEEKAESRKVRERGRMKGEVGLGGPCAQSGRQGRLKPWTQRAGLRALAAR